MPTPGRPKITVRLDEEELRQFQAMAHNAGITGAHLARLLIVNRIKADEDVTPFEGDLFDPVARLEWLKDQVECTKPGREMVWAVFDEVIDLVNDLLELNESMRNSLNELLEAARDRPA